VLTPTQVPGNDPSMVGRTSYDKFYQSTIFNSVQIQNRNRKSFNNKCGAWCPARTWRPSPKPCLEGSGAPRLSIIALTSLTSLTSFQCGQQFCHRASEVVCVCTQVSNNNRRSAEKRHAGVCLDWCRPHQPATAALKQPANGCEEARVGGTAVSCRRCSSA
jgi:hypothetical protein